MGWFMVVLKTIDSLQIANFQKSSFIRCSFQLFFHTNVQMIIKRISDHFTIVNLYSISPYIMVQQRCWIALLIYHTECLKVQNMQLVSIRKEFNLTYNLYWLVITGHHMKIKVSIFSFILKYYSFYSLKFLQTTYGLREIISCLLCF